MSISSLPKRRSQIMLDNDLYQRLVEESKLEGRSISSLVREAVQHWLEAREPRPIWETPFWELVGAGNSGQKPDDDPVSENVDRYLYHNSIHPEDLSKSEG
jgi:hypothetical protein